MPIISTLAAHYSQGSNRGILSRFPLEIIHEFVLHLKFSRSSLLALSCQSSFFRELTFHDVFEQITFTIGSGVDQSCVCRYSPVEFVEHFIHRSQLAAEVKTLVVRSCPEHLASQLSLAMIHYIASPFINLSTVHIQNILLVKQTAISQPPASLRVYHTPLFQIQHLVLDHVNINQVTDDFHRFIRLFWSLKSLQLSFVCSSHQCHIPFPPKGRIRSAAFSTLRILQAGIATSNISSARWIFPVKGLQSLQMSSGGHQDVQYFKYWINANKDSLKELELGHAYIFGM